MKEETDAKRWEHAKARADLKTHFSVYIVINSILWLTWLFRGGIYTHPWPVWPTVGWGIGILFNYLDIYKFSNTAENHYEKLKRG
jgi:hypothetical protein